MSVQCAVAMLAQGSMIKRPSGNTNLIHFPPWGPASFFANFLALTLAFADASDPDLSDELPVPDSPELSEPSRSDGSS